MFIIFHGWLDYFWLGILHVTMHVVQEVVPLVLYCVQCPKRGAVAQYAVNGA